MVHESTGPVAGSESQNWVSRSCPPGALKQQVSVTTEVLWHDSSAVGPVGHDCDEGEGSNLGELVRVDEYSGNCKRERGLGTYGLTAPENEARRSEACPASALTLTIAIVAVHQFQTVTKKPSNPAEEVLGRHEVR